MNIFPKLNGSWAKVNLDKESRELALDYANPLVCAKWVNGIHAKLGVAYSFGGFLEDRSNIWRNTYLKETKSFMHLGIDYNVPAGTSVALPIDAKVCEIVRSKDANGGWGGAIKFNIADSDVFFILAHLEHNIKLGKGDFCRTGEIIGRTGESSENGGWYPHLHAQFFTKKFDDAFGGAFSKLDGYLPKGSELIKQVINPKNYIK
ncbi:Peptidase family M23 [uncultured archaeon]|nr:Peptidase family M23 [uncultured archaeon]